jgi:toxin ParE1/3/4
MTAKPYRLLPLAEADLEMVWLYTLENWSVAQADSYHRDLVAAFALLASGQKRGRATSIRPGYLKYLCGANIYSKPSRQAIKFGCRRTRSISVVSGMLSTLVVVKQLFDIHVLEHCCMEKWPLVVVNGSVGIPLASGSALQWCL